MKLHHFTFLKFKIQNLKIQELAVNCLQNYQALRRFEQKLAAIARAGSGGKPVARAGRKTLRRGSANLRQPAGRICGVPVPLFVRSGLRADERKVFELDARERGSFQHDVLKTFHEELTAEGKRWRDLKPAEARERIGKIAAAQTEHFRDGLFRDSAE